MWKNIIISLFLYFASVQAKGKLSILNYPPSLDFKGDEKLDFNYLGDFITAAMGYYVNSDIEWSGLHLNDPFSCPKTTVAVIIDDIESINFNDKIKTYPLVGDLTDESLNMVSSILEEDKSIVIDLDLSQGKEALKTYYDVFGDLKIPNNNKLVGSNLKPDLYSEDKLFLQQIEIIKTIADKIKNMNKVINFLAIHLSLNQLATAHGENSPVVTEAVKMLTEAIEKFSESTQNGAYKDNVLFIVVSNKHDILSRSRRQAQPNDVDPSELNLATEYDEDYPVIFNIILWFGVAFFFSLLAISYVIATMDPGRDSIIYRMTSTRIKKDN